MQKDFFIFKNEKIKLSAILNNFSILILHILNIEMSGATIL